MRLIASLILYLLSQTIFAFEMVDDQGIVVQFKQPPRRIVSLLPSITESICMLGKCSLLVGVDRYSDWPKELATLPKVGGGLDPNIEAILALKPDLVLVGPSPRAAEHLRNLGIKVFYLDVKSYLDVRQALLRLAKILEVPEKVPQKIWLNINLGIDKAIQSIPPFQIKPRVYFEVNRAPYAAGPSSFIGATLHRLGLENIIPLSQGAFPKINPELVVKENPDFIMVGDENYSGMSDRPGWSAIKAIKNGDVCIFKEKDANVIVRPGPRIAEGAQAIANCIADKVAPSKWKAIN